jgi:alginate O-acetyltransferase complex protein AlgI
VFFNSWEFLILLVVTLGLYYGFPSVGLRKVWQVTTLLVASAIFYAWEDPRLLVLLGASCLLNAWAVERILFYRHLKVSEYAVDGITNGRSHDNQATRHESAIGGPEAKARQWLVATVVFNLAFIAFFKYAGFLANLLPGALLPLSLKQWLSGIPLPVGISFYTFQGISLVVDVWRSEISENTSRVLAGRGKSRLVSIRDTSFYISFFPQLVAGPIVKAHEFVDQIGSKHWVEIDWKIVRRCLILGFFLKIFVADNLAEQTAALTFGPAALEGAGPFFLMPLLYGYSFQIFADFAGYSLIAIGLGALFGYHLPENFRFPYLSTSITDFWRRWHLSLSSWLRDYLYIPLGGNRKGPGRTYFNLFLVMFLGGLWHGAAWKFALWGSLHGMFLALERLATRKQWSEVRGRESGDRSQGAGDGRLEAAARNQSSILNPSLISHSLLSGFKWILTFHIVTFLWLTFMMPDMVSIAGFFRGLASGRWGIGGPAVFSLVFYGSAVVLYHFWGWMKEHRAELVDRLQKMPGLEGGVHALLLFLVVTNPGAPQGFIYFQF